MTVLYVLSNAGLAPRDARHAALSQLARTLTNYTATLGQPPLEPALEPHAWRE